MTVAQESDFYNRSQKPIRLSSDRDDILMTETISKIKTNAAFGNLRYGQMNSLVV